MTRKQKKKPVTPIVRMVVQIATFLFVFLGSSAVALRKSGIEIPLPAFEVHGVCPFGGVETFYTLVTTGAFLQKTQMSAVILLIVVLVATVVFGSVFCGWFCPFGTLQEFIGKIGKRLFPRIYNKVPRRADRILRYLRYVMLVAILVVTARIGKMAFESIDPYSALMNILSDEVAWGGLVFLAIVVVASLFIERPFCKYVCPFGAMLGLVSLVSIFRPRRNAATCIGCKKCDHACPMNITVSETTAVRDHQCISCYRCTSDDVCPVPNTVTLATPRLGQGAQVSEGADAKTQADQAKGSEVRHEN